MEISSILVGLILLGTSLFFVSVPFRKKQPKDIKVAKVDIQGEQRELVLSTLRDLDFDFRIGKVTEEDYTPLRAQLMAKAAQYMETEEKENEQLEALIRTRRVVHQLAILCEHCGASMEADQRFCAKCGSPVNKEQCPSCRKKIRAGDQFCSSCGNSLEVRVEAVAHS